MKKPKFNKEAYRGDEITEQILEYITPYPNSITWSLKTKNKENEDFSTEPQVKKSTFSIYWDTKLVIHNTFKKLPLSQL